MRKVELCAVGPNPNGILSCSPGLFRDYGTTLGSVSEIVSTPKWVVSNVVRLRALSPERLFREGIGTGR